MLFISVLRFALQLENRKRDRLQAAEQEQGEEHRQAPQHEKLPLTDRTDGENLNFRYVL